MAQKKQLPAKGKVKETPIVDRLEPLSPSTPIPFESGRGFSYVTNTEYLPFLSGDDSASNDAYGKLLLQSRLLSCTQNACVTTKKEYCAGDGFQTKEEGDITDKKFNLWLPSMNLKGNSVTHINRAIFESFFTFGNAPIEVVRFTLMGKKYFYVYPHNFLQWRLIKPDEDDICHGAIQSKLFLRDNIVFTQDDYKNSRILPIYNPIKKDKAGKVYSKDINWLIDKNGAERTLIWYKNSTSGFDHYGLPSSVATLIYQILEYKGARFNLDNFENNMIISGLFAIRGNLTEKEVNRIGKKVVGSHTGDGKRGRVITVASEEGIEGSDFHTFDTHKEGSFKESDDSWMQKIILGNQWDSMLAGLVHANSSGKGVNFLTKILEIKKNTVIIPAQKDLVTEVWSIIIGLANTYCGFNVDTADLQIKNSIDISGLTDVDITPAVTVDEVREAKGLPAAKDKKKGAMHLGELGAEQKKGVYVKETKKPKKEKSNV